MICLITETQAVFMTYAKPNGANGLGISAELRHRVDILPCGSLFIQNIWRMKVWLKREENLL